MKVILKQDIKGVGKKYEIKNVADGYANNFLIPNKLAEFASVETIKKFEIIKKKNIVETEIRESLTKKQIEMLKGIKIVISKKANEKGHLFEKIRNDEIIKALQEQAKIIFDSEHLKIKEPIKEVGEYKIDVILGNNRGEFILIVEGI